MKKYELAYYENGERRLFGCEASSCHHAVELLALELVDNHEILKLGTNEFCIIGENEFGEEVELDVVSIKRK